MNTKDEGGALDFIRSIPPLEFDPALLQDYLESLRTATMSSEVTDLVETLYWDIEGDQRSERLNMLSLIANPQVDFDIGECFSFDDVAIDVECFERNCVNARW